MEKILTEKACVICTQNSTAMPTAMTRLTTETAFSWIFRIAITPYRSSSFKQMLKSKQTIDNRAA